MTEDGKIDVSPRAVAIIAAQAVSECYGVVGLSALTLKDALLTLLGLPAPTKGIRVFVNEGVVNVDVHVIIEYGTHLGTVAENVIDAVRFHLEQALGTTAIQVNVIVENVRVRLHSQK